MVLMERFGLEGGEKTWIEQEGVNVPFGLFHGQKEHHGFGLLFVNLSFSSLVENVVKPVKTAFTKIGDLPTKLKTNIYPVRRILLFLIVFLLFPISSSGPTVQVVSVSLIPSSHHRLLLFKMSKFDCDRSCLGAVIRRQIRALTCLIILLSISHLPFIQCNNIQEPEVTESASEHSSGGTGVEFPPMFVLNLPRSTERWSAAKQQMDEAGLTVQRFDAIDGRELSKEELRKVSTSLAMFLQPRGVLGCYLSHRAFWQVTDHDHA